MCLSWDQICPARFEYQPTCCRRDRNKWPVLAELVDSRRQAAWIRDIETIVTECFRKRVKAVQKLIGFHPKRAGPVLKQRIDVDPTEAFGTLRIVFEDFEVITVVAIQAVPCPEPNKPLVTLNDIRNPDLREALGTGCPGKADVLTLDDRKPDVFNVHRESSEDVSARSPTLAPAAVLTAAKSTTPSGSFIGLPRK